MATTVPGGRYMGADGTWHDADGKPLAAPDVKPAVNDQAASEPEQPKKAKK